MTDYTAFYTKSAYLDSNIDDLIILKSLLKIFTVVVDDAVTLYNSNCLPINRISEPHINAPTKTNLFADLDKMVRRGIVYYDCPFEQKDPKSEQRLGQVESTLDRYLEEGFQKMHISDPSIRIPSVKVEIYDEYHGCNIWLNLLGNKSSPLKD